MSLGHVVLAQKPFLLFIHIPTQGMFWLHWRLLVACAYAINPLMVLHFNDVFKVFMYINKTDLRLPCALNGPMLSRFDFFWQVDRLAFPFRYLAFTLSGRFYGIQHGDFVIQMCYSEFACFKFHGLVEAVVGRIIKLIEPVYFKIIFDEAIEYFA